MTIYHYLLKTNNQYTYLLLFTKTQWDNYREAKQVFTSWSYIYLLNTISNLNYNMFIVRLTCYMSSIQLHNMIYSKQSKYVFNKQSKYMFDKYSKYMFYKQSKYVFNKQLKYMFYKQSKYMLSKQSKYQFYKKSKYMFNKRSKYV